MAVAATCLVDDFQARRFEVGAELARFALVELLTRLELQEQIAAQAGTAP